jgi:hypothetical protein
MKPQQTFFLILGILALPAKAHALGPLDVEIGASAGVAGPHVPALLGFGVGGRAGVSFLSGLYAGIGVIDYLGGVAPCESCKQGPTGPGMVGAPQSAALLYGLEAGYDLKVSLVTIRPQFGVGRFSLVPGFASNSVYFEPGVVGLVSLGRLFVGADVGALFIDSSTSFGPGFVVLTFHGQIGATF